ncbi:MAG: hypothetical protein PWR01_2461 [Clostridiales bacterium]|jgi:hypothetical protein|nr:hypothetical protein [Clostridiales bacterium]MDN5281388.1 hypothetical protein [Candidatus Ozemobacter sp.]
MSSFNPKLSFSIRYFVLAALVALLSLPAFAGSDWVIDDQVKFKIKIPKNYQRSRMVEGTDVVHAFLSPDQNVAVRVRAIAINGSLPVDTLIQIFEQNIIKGAQRLLIDNYKLNQLSGKICGYKWAFNNVPVGLAVFYTVQNNFAYVVWSIVPQNIYKQRTAEGDAIINTFALLQTPSHQNTSGLAGTLTRKPQNKPVKTAKPSKSSHSHASAHSSAKFFDLVSDDAKITHRVPNGFKLVEKEEGQSIWKNSTNIKMVVQTIIKQGSFESFVDGLVADIKDNGATVLSNMYTVENGLKVANYSYKYGDNYFSYGATSGTGVNYMVGFVGTMSQKSVIDNYSEEANLSLKAVK